MTTRNVLLLLVAAGGLAAQTAGPPSPWWRREPLRILDLVTSLGRIEESEPAKLAEWKAAQLYNSEHLEIMEMHRGLDDRGFYFQSRLAGKVNRDYLREYVAQARRRGLRIMIYFNVHWYTEAFAAQHLEWRQIRETGEPLTGVYDNGTDLCLNTPWREWCFQLLRDLAAYGIDGIFYDGPIYRADTCFCRYCREKYRRQHGGELPSKKIRQGAEARKLLEFQAGSMAEFLRDSNRVLKSIDPDIAFYMNGGVRGANWATARLNRALVEHQDLLGSEGGFIYGDLTRVPMWKPGLTARLLETQAGGKPTVIFSAAAHKPWTFSLLPAPELRLLYADSIANGAGVWMGLTRFDTSQPEMRTLAEMNRFTAANGRYYTGARSAARAALVWSDVTANFYGGAPAQMIDIDRIPQRSAVGNVDSEFNGLAEALIRAHAPFDVIDDVTLEKEPLDRYGAIFLPNVAAMSARTADRLTSWVQRGGGLFATFETSLYDETGVRRPDFALAPLFGASDAGRISGPDQWDFMKPVARHWLLAGIEREMLPASTYHVRVKPGDAEVLMRFTQPLKGRYDGIPELSPDPALTVRRHGKGAVVYFSGDLGNLVAAYRLPEFLRLVANAAARLAPPPVTLENAPASVEVVWRAQPESGRRLLHLVNFTGEMTRPMTRVLPLTDVRITLSEGESASKAHTLVRPRSLPITRDARNRVRVTLPRADEYEVVVFER